eukprot:Skav236628  [mRNA]  locus=scaffold2276:65822:70131:- [translate_table: standard]
MNSLVTAVTRLVSIRRLVTSTWELAWAVLRDGGAPVEHCASDEAIALLLASDDASPPPRDFRAEARSRVQARRREDSPQWLNAMTAAESADSHDQEAERRDSDEEFYAELWGMHEAPVGRRNSHSRRMRENPGLRRADLFVPMVATNHPEITGQCQWVRAAPSAIISFADRNDSGEVGKVTTRFAL